MKLRNLAAATLAVFAFAAPEGSKADPITFESLGDQTTFHYGGTVDGANLCADVTYTLASWAGSSAIFNVSATNCSGGAGSTLNPNRLVSFAIGIVNPDLVSAVVPGVSEWDAVTDANFPSAGTVDLCSYAGATCSGGSSLGVFMGATDIFDVTLSLASAVGASNPITFDGSFFSKWQSVGLSGSGFTATNQVPEPATLGLLALGFAGFAIVVRRRRD